jgi:hypothetical protein
MNDHRSGRPRTADRRPGYAGAILVNAAVWYVLNIWPGWQELPFLTEGFSQVLALLNAALVASVVLNVVYLVHDGPWLKSICDLAMTVLGLVVLLRMWQVFPFALGDSERDWALMVRVVLGLAVFGTAIAIVAQLAMLVVRAAGGPKAPAS